MKDKNASTGESRHDPAPWTNEVEDLEGAAHTMNLPHFCDPAMADAQKSKLKLDLLPAEIMAGPAEVKVASLDEPMQTTPLLSKRKLTDGDTERYVACYPTLIDELNRLRSDVGQSPPKKTEAGNKPKEVIISKKERASAAKAAQKNALADGMKALSGAIESSQELNRALIAYLQKAGDAPVGDGPPPQGPFCKSCGATGAGTYCSKCGAKQ